MLNKYSCLFVVTPISTLWLSDSDTSDLFCLNPWTPPLLCSLCSCVLTIQMLYSMTLWPTTFTSFNVLRTLLYRVVLPRRHGSAISRPSYLCLLPVHRRIQCKNTLITYSTGSFLRNLLTLYRPSRCLRSAY